MRCTECKRPVASGVDARKMIVEYVQDDDTVKTFGFGMSDGPLTAATGRLRRGFHHKCFHIARKRSARGDSGRVVAGAPGAYDDPAVTDLSRQLSQMRAVATEIGLPIGDPTVTEAFLARSHGGPYDHVHHFRLDNYQLISHLYYGHGVPYAHIHDTPDLHELHAAEHTAVQVADDHADDFGHTDPPPRDWRDQHTIDV